MKVLHPNPRPTAPRPRAHSPAGLPSALPPGHLLAARLALALALTPLLLVACTDDVAANCPPLAHPEVLTFAAAAGNPCAGGER